MVVLNDSALHHEADKGMIKPYNPLHVQPCSIDLTLGSTVKIESLDQNSDGWVDIDITNPYEVRPGQFLLATTAETLKMPDDISGQIALRSSAARLGWDHCLSGWIDSGFAGTVTLELRNNKQLSNLTIQSGMRLVQLVCFQLNFPASTPYYKIGNYCDQQGVTPSNNNLAPMIAD